MAKITWISVRDRIPEPGTIALRYRLRRERGESVYAHYSVGPVLDESAVLCDYWHPLTPPGSPA